MLCSISLIGGLPAAARRLVEGEWPRAQDTFERHEVFRKEEWDEGAGYSKLESSKYDRSKVEAGWRRDWGQKMQ